MITQPETRESIVQLLSTCEETPPHKVSLVEISSEGRELVIVSDLHLSQGRTPMGTYGGTENFYSDESFERFLAYVNARLAAKGKRKGILVINGDFIDFLRVISVPRGEHEYQEWQGMLRRIGITDKSIDDLKKSISPKERDLGLKTDDYKSVWKLAVAVRGHAVMFDALARWIGDGHSLIVLKGNHDLEWYWLAVRNFLRLTIADRLSSITRASRLSDSLSAVLSRCTFIDTACVIDKEVYLEHGHRYDKFTRVLGSPTWGEHNAELNLPFGSFFNRYLINKIELVYPFLDNLRPSQNILHMLMRERFFLGLKVLFYYLPFTVQMIPKRYVRYMVKPVLGYAIALGLPLIGAAALWGDRIISLLSSASPGTQPVSSVWEALLQYGSGFLKDASLLFLSYLFSRFVSYVQLEEVGYLMEPARKKLEENPAYRLVSMGHTHNPEQFQEKGRWYINSSTWIPVIESSSAALREDKMYAVIYLERDNDGRLIIKPLQRWNDDAGRIETMTVIDQK